MRIIQAIGQINRIYGELSEDNKMALDVLIEKQIAKKPTHDGIRHTCPDCHMPLPNVAHNNCMYCGQAIDWSE